MHEQLARLAREGQSVWVDYIRRDMIHGGALQRMIDEGVVGLTSNPTIFQKAIAESADYLEQIDSLVRAGKNADQIYEALVFQDIRDAADLLAQVYRRSNRNDGFVSIEVNPRFAHDARATVDEGRRIFQTLDRPNLMVKVPGTRAGLPAIEQLLSEGINVNVTLIFSIASYRDVMQAYLRGARRWMDGGGDPAALASVASFFVSRIDTAVDSQLEDRRAQPSAPGPQDSLLGQAAIANAKLAYAAYQQVFDSGSGEFPAMRKNGCRAQRPLWASTSTKNPRYRPTYYVDSLVGPNTVNTVPPATLDAIKNGLTLHARLTDDVAGARAVFDRLAGAGINLDAVTDGLQLAGVKAFSDSFDSLMKDLDNRLRAASQGPGVVARSRTGLS